MRRMGWHGRFVPKTDITAARREQRCRRGLATTGPYSYVRHPQYVGFVLVMFGFLLQWPTILTLAMFPVLVWMYARLARQEEHDAMSSFGQAYADYAACVPGFIPRLDRIRQQTS
jgi:protein-S-isoprenylcysteine O-methyltransferase Ste14